jgi:hypothetical protein
MAGGAAELESGAGFFEKRIRALLADRCAECRGETMQKCVLRLDSKAAWQKRLRNLVSKWPARPRDGIIAPGAAENSVLPQFSPQMLAADLAGHERITGRTGMPAPQ